MNSNIIKPYYKDSKYIGIKIDEQEINNGSYEFNTYVIDTITVQLHIYHTSNTIPIKLSKIKYYINSFINGINTSITTLVIILIPTNIKKKFPDFNANKVIVTSENCNNGLTTTFSDSRKEILIYRYEDLYKVLIHEMIHYFDLDLKTNYNIVLPNLFNTLEDENKLINLNEAYVETLAVVLYHIYKYDGITRLKMIKKHRIRSIRIMNALTNSNKTIHQKSHMFSYYICKAILFDNLPAFLEIVINNYTDLEKVNKIIVLLESKRTYSRYPPLKTMQVIE